MNAKQRSALVMIVLGIAGAVFSWFINRPATAGDAMAQLTTAAQLGLAVSLVVLSLGFWQVTRRLI